MQVLRYEVGQKYEAHMDAFSDAFNQDDKKGGQRVATVLMYLSDVESGGETVFPETSEKPHEGDDPGFGVRAEGRRGEGAARRRAAFLVHGHLREAGREVHARGVPRAERREVVRHEVDARGAPSPYGHKATFKPGVCDDEEDKCAAWARAGECEKNPAYMVGNKNEDGHCMRSCGKCPAGSRPKRKTRQSEIVT